MTIELEWQPAMALRRFSDRDEQRVLDLLEDEPGIYVFARRWGQGFEVLYIGQALKIAGRVKQQFNNHKLLRHIEDAKIGAKVLLVGYLSYDGKTNVARSLGIAERAFIRYAVSHGHEIHNKLGTKLRIDEVLSSGGLKKSPFPKMLGVERR